MFACRVFAAPLLWIPLMALSSYGCDEGTATRIGPSRINSDARFVSSSVSVQATDISAVPVPGGICPFVSPFLAPVNLVISAGGSSEMRLQQVQMQFVDISGVSESFRTISSLELSTLFGSTLIPAFGTRAFPLSFPFGCVGGPAGILNIRVAGDSAGRSETGSIQVNVRPDAAMPAAGGRRP